MKFTDLNFQPHPNYRGDGIQAKHFFPNGYGVSVVQFPGSYGFEQGLYELAVIRLIGENQEPIFDADFEICYDTHITSDVVGHLTESDVENLLDDVSAL